MRNQTNEFSKRVRSRVKKEQELQLAKIGKKEIQHFITLKENELAGLEREYQNALEDIGMGHKGIKEQEEYERWKKVRKQRDAETAERRGHQAFSKINFEKITEKKLKENKINLKKSIALAERLRAAEIRANNEVINGINKVRVVEIDAKTKEKKVRFLDRGNVLNAGEDAENVRRKPLSDISTNGVEAAIREQEIEEQKRWEEENRQIEISKIRGEAALRKLIEEKENHNKFSYRPYDSSDSSNYIPARKLNSAEELEEDGRHFRTPTVIKSRGYWPKSTHSILPHSDLDQIPVRGPSSTDISSTTPSSSKSSSNNSADVSGTPILDAVISRFPTDNGSRPLMGGPTSAFKDPKTGERSTSDAIDDKETTVGTPTQGSPKTNEGDRDFISKVLKDFDFVQHNGLKVKIDVQELSTINSMLSITQEQERSSHGDITRTTIKSSTSASLSSSSSIDITKEKFLSEQWRQRQIQDQGYTAPNYDQLHGLIRQLESKDNRNAQEAHRQNQLRTYIEKLLQMKRKEIDDLSISDVSSFSTTQSSSFKESSNNQSSTSSSSLGTPQSFAYQRNGQLPPDLQERTSESRNINDTNMQHTKKFTSSTPTSILSSSDSKSSGNKTVRFADEEHRQTNSGKANELNNKMSEVRRKQTQSSERRGSYEGIDRNVSLSSDELERQRHEIISRTKLSLEQIRNYYEGQRRKIELELQKRKIAADLKRKIDLDEIKYKQVRMMSPIQLSEGPLSTETDSYYSSPENKDHGEHSHENSNSSQKESSLSSNNNNAYFDIVNIGLKKLQLNLKGQHLAGKKMIGEALNKTSSSGTTTSSSNATAELLSRIRRMEMPTLTHPPPTFWEEQSTKQVKRTEDLGSPDQKHFKDHPSIESSKEIKKLQRLGETERKKAEQSLGGASETVSFSSFHLSGQESCIHLSEEYSSINLSSDEHENL